MSIFKIYSTSSSEKWGYVVTNVLYIQDQKFELFFTGLF